MWVYMGGCREPSPLNGRVAELILWRYVATDAHWEKDRLLNATSAPRGCLSSSGPADVACAIILLCCPSPFPFLAWVLVTKLTKAMHIWRLLSTITINSGWAITIKSLRMSSAPNYQLPGKPIQKIPGHLNCLLLSMSGQLKEEFSERKLCGNSKTVPGSFNM